METLTITNNLIDRELIDCIIVAGPEEVADGEFEFPVYTADEDGETIQYLKSFRSGHTAICEACDLAEKLGGIEVVRD